MNKWISVDDKLPESNTWVLMVDKDGWMVTAIYERINVQYQPGYIDKWDSGHCCGREPEKPTHWMPLPELPKGET
jgi:Protein of unknown function (DUF551)